jgi:hypothetical protein
MTQAMPDTPAPGLCRQLRPAVDVDLGFGGSSDLVLTYRTVLVKKLREKQAQKPVRKRIA